MGNERGFSVIVIAVSRSAEQSEGASLFAEFTLSEAEVLRMTSGSLGRGQAPRGNPLSLNGRGLK